jgi:Uracil DNA glycosylase superfamily
MSSVAGRRQRSTFGARVLDFYRSLEPPATPRGIAVMNPYRDATVMRYVRAFLDAYCADDAPRTLVFGINPGRFGSGVTGITFTDPIALADFCGIANHMPRRRELSSIFIYDVIERLGGVREFHRRFFLTAVCPLGFTRAGKNLNYYDDPRLERSSTPFIVESIARHLAIGGRRDTAIVVGAGANRRFLERLNETHRFFDAIHAVDHPRFIMQYRRRQLARYLDEYERVFLDATAPRST